MQLPEGWVALHERAVRVIVWGRRLLLASIVLFIVTVLAVLPGYTAYRLLHPPPCPWQPHAWSVEAQPFTVTTSDGVTLHGWVLGPGNKGPVFIVMHDYGSCLWDPRVRLLAEELARRGYVVAVFDFRGHGSSGGTTTLGVMEVLDAEAVIGYMSTRYPGRSIYLHGYGMGGAVAVMAAAVDARVTGVSADDPYPTVEAAVERWISSHTPLPTSYGWFVAQWLRLLSGGTVDPGFGPLALTGGLGSRPLLVVWESGSPILSRAEAEKIAGLSTCSRLVAVKGVGHAEALEKLGVERYADLLEWLLHPGCGKG